jgi:hypothetical protein
MSMTYSFARKLHVPVRGVGAGCAPCAAAAAARGSAGVTLASDESSGSTRAIATGVFVTSAIVGAVGFAAGAGLASTAGLFGVFGSMLVLAMQPTPVVAATEGAKP